MQEKLGDQGICRSGRANSTKIPLIKKK